MWAVIKWLVILGVASIISEQASIRSNIDKNLIFAFFIGVAILLKFVFREPTANENEQEKDVIKKSPEESSEKDTDELDQKIEQYMEIMDYMGKNELTTSEFDFSIDDEGTLSFTKVHQRDSYGDIVAKSTITISKMKQKYGKIEFLEWCSGQTYPLPKERYLGKFFYQFGIKNAPKLHKEYVESGALIKATDEEIYNNMTLPQLKETLKANNLKVSGKKAELIERLLENGIKCVDEKANLYVASGESKKLISENSNWKTFYRKTKVISESEFYETWQLLKNQWGHNPRYNDIAWGILQKYQMAALAERKFQFLADIKREIFEILKEDKKTEQAFQIALELCCLGMSGLEDEEKEYAIRFSSLPPAYFNYVLKNKELYNEELVKLIYKELHLKDSYMKHAQMIKFIKDAMSDPDKFDYGFSEFNKSHRKNSYYQQK